MNKEAKEVKVEIEEINIEIENKEVNKKGINVLDIPTSYKEFFKNVDNSNYIFLNLFTIMSRLSYAAEPPYSFSPGQAESNQ